MARLQETGITELVGLTQEQVFSRFGTSIKGLSDEEAEQRLQEYGFNELFKPKKRSIVFQIASKFLNPLVIVLLIIAIFSIVFGEIASAILVILMAIGSVSLSFFQEHRAGKEAEKLSEMVRPTATVYRNGITKEIPIREIVPGDIVYLSAGDMVPADLRIVSCKDLFVNQASLTGES
ncbi:MAG TPA: cation-transporting P-type ATPase, partial [bacterium]|nr:cation-transporting P-type ATPase [bacterium]